MTSAIHWRQILVNIEKKKVIQDFIKQTEFLACTYDYDLEMSSKYQEIFYITCVLSSQLNIGPYAVMYLFGIVFIFHLPVNKCKFYQLEKRS